MADTVPAEPDKEPATERKFGWWDMFVQPEDDPRSDGGYVVAFAERFVAEAPHLDITGTNGDERERIDGRVGQEPGRTMSSS